MTAKAEQNRLAEDLARKANWKRWGPYLSERSWGTVREDYSANGDVWNYFPRLMQLFLPKGCPTFRRVG